MRLSAAQRFTRDAKAGLTVALVSIPLSLSLAIASGAPPLTGILTAVWAGLFAAIFGGSRFNVIGPAGALSGILMSFALTSGAEYLPLLAISSGILIFTVFLFRWDKTLVLVPSSVIHGFTLGVGLTIAMTQINAALGLTHASTHHTVFLNVVESLSYLPAADPATAMLFAIMLSALLLLARVAPRFPGVVLIAAVGIVIGTAADTGVSIIGLDVFAQTRTLIDAYGPLQATFLQVPTFSFAAIDGSFVSTTVTVAVVAVLETLLSAKIADGMTGTRYDQRREVLGLSCANIASGLMGGLPATGVLVRTALNVTCGAQSRMASAMNAVFVLLISFLLFRGFQHLPLAVVASILVFAAIRMVKVEHFTRMLRFDRRSFALALLVALLTVGIDAMIGILVGIALALLSFVQHLSRGQSELTLHRDGKLVARMPFCRIHEDNREEDVVVYRFAGELTYLNGQSHEDAIKKLKARTIVLSFRNLFYIDMDGLETVHLILRALAEEGKTVLLSGVGDFIRPLVEKVEWFQAKESTGMVFSSTTDALRSLGFAR